MFLMTAIARITNIINVNALYFSELSVFKIYKIKILKEHIRRIHIGIVFKNQKICRRRGQFAGPWGVPKG